MRRLSTIIKPQFVIYVAGGVLCAVIDIGIMQLLIVDGFKPVASASAGFVAGLLVNYIFHAKITFKNVMSPSTFLRFMCVVALNYLVTIGIVSLGVAVFQSALVGKIASLPVVAMNGFLLSKYWIYRASNFSST